MKFIDDTGILEKTPLESVNVHMGGLETESVVSRMGRILEDSFNEIFIFDARTLLFTMVNRGARENLGYTMDELGSMTAYDIKPEVTIEQFHELIAPLKSGKSKVQRFETTHKRKDGTLYDVSIRLQLYSDDGDPVYVAIVEDITERKRVEGESARIGRILEDSLNEIYIFDAQTCLFEKVNRGALSNIGYTMEEMRARTAYDIKPQFTREAFLEAVEPLKSGEKQFLTFEAEHERKNGTCYPVEIRLQLFKDEANPVFVAIINDITERKQAEAIHRENEARFAGTFNQSVIGVAHVDMEGNCLTVNDKFCDVTGWERDEIIGEDFKDLQLYDDLKIDRDEINQMLDGEIESVTTEKRMVSKDGDIVWVNLGTTLVRDKNDQPKYFITLIQDISKRKKAEAEIKELNASLESKVKDRTQMLERANGELWETLKTLKSTQKQLVDSEKMASLGGLVAGVAHEINTPVGVGVTATSHLKQAAGKIAGAFRDGTMKKTDFEGFLGTCEESTQIVLSNLSRASELIRSFKQVAVDQSHDEPRLVNLHDYLDEIILSLGPKLKKKGHKVIIDCDSDLEATLSPGSFSQIIANLVVNAVTHAFEDREAGEIKIYVERQKYELLVTFSDNGKGMPAEVVSKIYEPFFTTKRGGGGTGLGMHVLYNLVTQKLDGSIDCTSEEGTGTQFTLFIPVGEEGGKLNAANQR